MHWLRRLAGLACLARPSLLLVPLIGLLGTVLGMINAFQALVRPATASTRRYSPAASGSPC